MQLPRLFTYVQNLVPSSLISSLVEKQVNQRFDHALYNLKPKHRYAFTP